MRLAARVRLQDGRTEFGKRVSFEDARGRRVHGWYYFKEGFSPSLLGLILKKLGDVPEPSVFCDPFSGVSTSVLSATQLDPQPFGRAIGVERNPFAHFVGNTKLRWRGLDPERLRTLAKRISTYRKSPLPPIPNSATLRNRRIFSRTRLDDLRALRAGIDTFARRSAEHDVLRLALASILEASSFAKKDGRALRIVDPKERDVPPRQLFVDAVGAIARDVEQGQMMARRRAASRGKLRIVTAHVYLGDARKLPKQIGAGTVGLALYSPPYLNGIDYSEVYKVEEYFLGFVRSNDELRQLRKTTLRSHASIRFPKRPSAFDQLPKRSAVRKLIAAISAFVAAHETRTFQRQHVWLVPAYFADMYDALREQARVLRPGGYAVCVVGNSMLAGPALEELKGKQNVRHPKWQLPIATDLIIADLARAAGLRVRPSYAVRALFPRNVKRAWSRESILVFQKPTD